MSTVSGMAFVSRKSSATRIGGLAFACAASTRYCSICCCVAAVSFFSAAALARCGEISTK